MTKANSIKKIAAALLAAQFLLPLVASAQTRPPRDFATPNTLQDTGVDEAAGFCARVTTLIPQITLRLADRKANLEARRTEQKSKRTALRASQRGKIDELRAKEDGSRSSTMIKLTTRAKTTAQKTAVAQFKATMEAAVTARRSAMNAAQKNFQESLDSLIATRKTEDTATIAAYENAVMTALNKAKADCVGRIRETIVRERLRTALQAAREQFQASRNQLEPQGQAIQGLIETRKTAVQKAFDDFRMKAEAARTALKEAFAAQDGVK